MKLNTNIALKSRSKVTLKGFKGLDTLSSPIDVSAIHATDMENLISRDGVNHKRFGWKTRARLRDDTKYLSIKGIFNFSIFGEDFLIVYAGKKFWKVDTSNNEWTNITPKDANRLEDTECECFVNGNKAYFIGCNDYLVFSKWEDGQYILRRVLGSEDVYIPTTTENIGCEEDGTKYTRITAEEPNLLSLERYNLLFGRSGMGIELDKKYATYYLDSRNIKKVEVEVENSNGKVTLTQTDKKKECGKGEILTTVDCEGAITEAVSNYGVDTSLGTDVQIKVAPPAEIELITFANGNYIKVVNAVNEGGNNDYYEGAALGRGDKAYYPQMAKSVTSTLKYVIKESNEEIVLDKKIVNLESSAYKNLALVDGEEKLSGEVKIPYEFNIALLDGEKIDNIINGLDCYYSNIYKIASEDNTYYRGSIDLTEGKLVLDYVLGQSLAYAPIVADVPNIKVKITKENTDAINSLLSSKTACKFGILGASDRLFIVDSVGNVVRWSKDEDFTYFGEKSWCVCGTADKKITGMARLNDSTLILVKEYSINEPSVYVITGNFETSESEAKTVKYTSLFTPRGYMVGVGAVGKVINFNGDCLMVAKDGVYSISLGQNITVDARYIKHRSKQISNELEKFDLSKSKCISYDGKLFLSVGDGNCFVADNKYSTVIEGNNQDKVSYEWWRWTNIPAVVWGYVNNELWFGTEDGQLCSFSEQFNDEPTHFLKSGLVTYEVGTYLSLSVITGLAINKTIDIKNGDVLIPTCDFYTSSVAYGKAESYIGKELIVQIDESNSNENGPNIIKLKTLDGTELLWNQSKNQYMENANPPIENFTAMVIRKTPVKAKWISGAIDLGTRTYTKTLTALTITGEKDIANKFNYGLKTRFNNKEFELLRNNNDLDFMNLDMPSFSLDSQFASSYSRKLNIRDVNFLMFYFKSDVAEDIAINSVEVEFKLNNKYVGVK